MVFLGGEDSLPHSVMISRFLLRLFDNPASSDLKVKCKDRNFNVHKCIVASQGGFFGAKMDNFKEGDTNTIDLSNDDSDVVEAALRYLYGMKYKVPDSSEVNEAVLHARVYAFGEFAGLSDLKKVSLDRFKGKATNGKEGAAAAFLAAKVVYSEVPEEDRGLKNILVDAVYACIEIADDDGNKLILKAVPEFTYDLLVARAQSLSLASTPDSKTRKKSIKLHEDDPDIILSLLQYLYGMEYNTPEETEKAVFQANLYAAADFYQLPLLKKNCISDFETIARSSGPRGVKSAFLAAKAVYCGTPDSDRGLRDILVKTVNENISEIIDKDVGNQLILLDVPKLSYDLVRTRAKGALKPHSKLIRLAFAHYATSCIFL
ncbi:MAG: hypothetical protein Q9159_000286 [Coniocarpon cinnabarinum]